MSLQDTKRAFSSLLLFFLLWRLLVLHNASLHHCLSCRQGNQALQQNLMYIIGLKDAIIVATGRQGYGHSLHVGVGQSHSDHVCRDPHEQGADQVVRLGRNTVTVYTHQSIMLYRAVARERESDLELQLSLANLECLSFLTVRMCSRSTAGEGMSKQKWSRPKPVKISRFWPKTMDYSKGFFRHDTHFITHTQTHTRTHRLIQPKCTHTHTASTFVGHQGDVGKRLLCLTAHTLHH